MVARAPVATLVDSTHRSAWPSSPGWQAQHQPSTSTAPRAAAEPDDAASARAQSSSGAASSASPDPNSARVPWFTPTERARAAAVLERLGFAGLDRRPLSELSGGQLQRVLRAREPGVPRSDVVADRAGDQLHVLEHDADRGAEVLLSIDATVARAPRLSAGRWLSIARVARRFRRAADRDEDRCGGGCGCVEGEQREAGQDQRLAAAEPQPLPVAAYQFEGAAGDDHQGVVPFR